MAEQKAYYPYTILAAGDTVTFDVNEPSNVYLISANGGAVVLLAAMTFNYSGVPVIGTTFKVKYAGGVTSDTGTGKTVSFFGTNLTNAQALQPLEIESIWDGTVFQVSVLLVDNGSKAIDGAELVNLSVPTTALAASSVTLAKMANITRGSLIVGGVANAPTAVDFKTSGKIPIGDGTDINSVAVTGDVTISSAGVTTIGAAKVTAAMLNFTIPTYLEASLTIPTASVLILNGTPITIVAAPGAGKYIEFISGSTNIVYKSAAYATNTNLQLIFTGASVRVAIDAGVLISTVSKNTNFLKDTTATAGQTQILTNTALTVNVATGNPTAGDSDIIVKILYRIVTI